MKKIKIILLAVLPMFLAITAFGQGKVQITSAKQTFTQTETGSTTLFVYNGTAAEVTALQEKANNLKARLTLEMKKNSTGGYNCTLVVSQQNHAEYATKMFLTLGFEKVTIDGNEKPVGEIASDLKAMLLLNK